MLYKFGFSATDYLYRNFIFILQFEEEERLEAEGDNSDSEDEEHNDEEEDNTPVEVLQVPQITSPVKEIQVPTYVKPPMQDAEVWTHEPQYSRQLHVRVFKPEGLDFRELRCVLTCGGKQYHKTAPLDMPEVGFLVSFCRCFHFCF